MNINLRNNLSIGGVLRFLVINEWSKSDVMQSINEQSKIDVTNQKINQDDIRFIHLIL